MKNIILSILTIAAILLLMCSCRTTQVTSDSRASDTLIIRDTLIIHDSLIVSKKEIVTTTVRIKDSTVLVVDTTGRIYRVTETTMLILVEIRQVLLSEIIRQV